MNNLVFIKSGFAIYYGFLPFSRIIILCECLYESALRLAGCKEPLSPLNSAAIGSMYPVQDHLYR